MPEGKTILQVQGLTVGLQHDRSARILENVSFELGAGRVLGVIGEAGSGKTVLARAFSARLTHKLNRNFV